MKISVSYNNNNEINFIYSDEEIILVSEKMLKYAVESNFTPNYTDTYNYSFDVTLCDNDFIHEINKEYRKIDKPTDVITFALFADNIDKIIIDNTINLGQILISADKVSEQAEENNVTEKYEFLNLLSHGILHLIGFDHKDDNSLNYMLELQCKLIESIENVKV